MPKPEDVPIYTPLDFALPEGTYAPDSEIDFGLVIDVSAALERREGTESNEHDGDTESNEVDKVAESDEDDMVTIKIDITDASGTVVPGAFSPEARRIPYPKDGRPGRIRQRHITFHVNHNTHGHFLVRAYNVYMFNNDNSDYVVDSFDVP